MITLSPRYDTGLHFEKKYIAANGALTGAVEYEHYLYAGGLMFGKYITVTQTDGITLATTSIEYYSKDHLGSIVAITDGTGTVTQRLSYDVWGKRRYPNGAADPNGLLNNPDMYHGFTGHEMLDAVGLIHMNGRLYDPVMARFVSADPNIQDPLNLQSYNRYAYVLNNPLNLTDPSGYFSLGNFLRTVAAIAVAVYAPQFIASSAFAGSVAAATGLSTVTIGAVTAGAISGAISTGSVQGAITGGLTAGMFGGLHGWEPSGFLDSAMKVAAHGAVGGIASVLQGGDFKSGFMASAFTQAASLSGAFDGIQSRMGNAVAAAVVGGTASVLGGGKFENGAVTGAFSRMFNDWLYHQSTGDMEHVDNETGKITHVGKGYAGYGAGLNNSDMQDVQAENHGDAAGPLPRGTYDIGSQYDSPNTGRGTMKLSPRAGTEMFGRSLFRIHGDNAQHNYTASQGCIIMDRNIRNQINNSTDRVLKVAL